MSKFLKIVEENRPLTSQELDRVTPIKRFIQRAFLSDENGPMLENLGLERVIVTDRSNDIILKFKDGVNVIYTAEIVQEEENESEVIAAARSAKGIDQNLDAASKELETTVSSKANTMIPVLKRVSNAVKNTKVRV